MANNSIKVTYQRSEWWCQKKAEEAGEDCPVSVYTTIDVRDLDLDVRKVLLELHSFPGQYPASIDFSFGGEYLWDTEEPLTPEQVCTLVRKVQLCNKDYARQGSPLGSSPRALRMIRTIADNSIEDVRTPIFNDIEITYYRCGSCCQKKAEETGENYSTVVCDIFDLQDLDLDVRRILLGLHNTVGEYPPSIEIPCQDEYLWSSTEPLTVEQVCIFIRGIQEHRDWVTKARLSPTVPNKKVSRLV